MLLPIFFNLISFFCKPGTLISYDNNIRYFLKCEPKVESCYFNIDLPNGLYSYVSEDKKDTTIFEVLGPNKSVLILKTNGGFLLN